MPGAGGGAGEEGGGFSGLAGVLVADEVEGGVGLGGVVAEDGDGSAGAAAGDFGAVEACGFVFSDEVDEEVAFGGAEEGVVGVAEVRGVHEVAGFVEEELSFAGIGGGGGDLEELDEVFDPPRFEDVVVGGVLDGVAGVGFDAGGGVAGALGVSGEELVSGDELGEVVAEEAFVVIGVEVGEVSGGGIAGEFSAVGFAHDAHAVEEDGVGHEGGAAGDAVLAVGDGVSDVGVDADDADAGGEGEGVVEGVWLAGHEQEFVLFAAHGGDLVHESAGGADDFVFDALAEGGGFEGADAGSEGEVVEEVDHGSDLDGGGGGDACAEGDIGEECEVEAGDVGVGEVDEAVELEDVEAAGDVGGELASGGVELASEAVGVVGGEGVQGDAEGEGLVLVVEVEGEDLDDAVAAFGEEYGGGAGEGHFGDE